MKLLHLTKIATFATLLAITNISCASEPTRPSATIPSTSSPTNPNSTEPTTSAPNIQGEPATAATGGHQTAIPATAFKTDKNGSFIPVNKYGKEFVPCSTNSRGTCEINNKPVIINKLETTVITEIVHTGSPMCLLYCIQRPSGFPQKCFYDPSVPDCAALNR